MEFLLNAGSRAIHNANSKDGRCRIGMISDRNKKIFSTYQEAKEHLANPHPCTFCLGKDYEKNGEGE